MVLHVVAVGLSELCRLAKADHQHLLYKRLFLLIDELGIEVWHRQYRKRGSRFLLTHLMEGGVRHGSSSAREDDPGLSHVPSTCSILNLANLSLPDYLETIGRGSRLGL